MNAEAKGQGLAYRAAGNGLGGVMRALLDWRKQHAVVFNRGFEKREREHYRAAIDAVIALRIVLGVKGDEAAEERQAGRTVEQFERRKHFATLRSHERTEFRIRAKAACPAGSRFAVRQAMAIEIAWASR